MFSSSAAGRSPLPATRASGPARRNEIEPLRHRAPVHDVWNELVSEAETGRNTSAGLLAMSQQVQLVRRSKQEVRN